MNLYFGVFHSLHTNYSCGKVTLEEFYEFVKDKLDFVSLTDHDIDEETEEWGFSDEGWARYQLFAKQNNKPDRFVSFLGYEWTAPGDHKHVVFCGDCPERKGYNVYKTPQELFAFLSANGGLAAYSHPSSNNGKLWKGNYQRDKYGVCPNIAIWTGWRWGRCEWAADYDVCIYSKFAEENPQGFVRDILGKGYHLGFVGEWDENIGYKYLNLNGCTGVYADSLTREGILNAVKKRHHYGTSGEKIKLKFTDNAGHMMGDVFTTGNPTPTFNIEVEGTNILTRARLFKDGEIVYTKSLDSGSAKFFYTDKDGIGDAKEHYYFVEIQQKGDGKDEEYKKMWGSPHYEYAWSSPMYITYSVPA